MGKGEIARIEQFLLFPPCFLLDQIIVSPFVHIFDIISLFAAEFEDPKISISGKGLITEILFKTALYYINDSNLQKTPRGLAPLNWRCHEQTRTRAIAKGDDYHSTGPCKVIAPCYKVSIWTIDS